MQRLCKARAMKLASIAEPQPILCKHFANERKESFTLNLPSAAKCYAKIVQGESNEARFNCRAAANLMQRYNKFRNEQRL